MFEDFGEWQRPAAFPRNRESRAQAIARESRLVRNGVGLYDSSSLGKIEPIGPDALAFADRFYINNLMTLKPGRARYGIMLRETGMIFDDGTAVILDDDRVLLTTTSSGAGRVAAWLEEWRQCEWLGIRVIVAPVTDHWATVALTGRHARTILERLRPDCDLSNEAFPHLGFRATQLLGSEARIYRVSFSGELTYEINVPADIGPHLWSALRGRPIIRHRAPTASRPCSTCVWRRVSSTSVLTPMARQSQTMWASASPSSKQTHYVGKRSLTLPENVRPDRLQLVGLAGEGTASLPVGSHLRLPGTNEPTDGWITSAGHLSTDGKPIALALLRAGRSQINRTVSVHDEGRVVTNASVVPPMFYDPLGARMNA